MNDNNDTIWANEYIKKLKAGNAQKQSPAPQPQKTPEQEDLELFNRYHEHMKQFAFPNRPMRYEYRNRIPDERDPITNKITKRGEPMLFASYEDIVKDPEKLKSAVKLLNLRDPNHPANIEHSDAYKKRAALFDRAFKSGNLEDLLGDDFNFIDDIHDYRSYFAPDRKGLGVGPLASEILEDTALMNAADATFGEYKGDDVDAGSKMYANKILSADKETLDRFYTNYIAALKKNLFK